jgi:hypothetical protein
LQAGGRRFDPDQLHQFLRDQRSGIGNRRGSTDRARETSNANCSMAERFASGVSPERNRLLFNNSEGKAFVGLDESFTDKKG